jgi:two-component system nitrogen regulation response regulator NtrX
VRELKNAVERSAILSADHVTIADLPEDPHASPFEEESDPPGDAGQDSMDDDPPGDGGRASIPPPGGRPATLREFRERSERQYIVDTLKMTGWNISRTAIVLGVERTNLHKKIRAYQIKRGEG